MGAACGVHSKVDQDPDKLLNTDRKPNILVIGCGGSGKSTLVNSIRATHETGKEGWTHKERKQYTTVVHTNIFETLRRLVFQVRLTNNTKQDFYALRRHVSANLYNDITLNGYHKDVLTNLWKETQDTFHVKQTVMCLPENFPYFMDEKNLSRILDTGYTPNMDDILRSFTRTTGIVEYYIKLNNGTNVGLTELGGQRNERVKWVPALSNATALIFTVGLGGFDEVMYEDANKYRLVEALDVWLNLMDENVTQTKHFRNVPITLIFTRTDSFERKFNQPPQQGQQPSDKNFGFDELQRAFPDYDKSTDPLKFVVNLFQQAIPNNLEKSVQIKFVNALDMNEVQTIFGEACKHLLDDPNIQPLIRRERPEISRLGAVSQGGFASSTAVSQSHVSRQTTIDVNNIVLPGSPSMHTSQRDIHHQQQASVDMDDNSGVPMKVLHEDRLRVE